MNQMNFRNKKIKFQKTHILLVIIAIFLLGNSGFRKLVRNLLEHNRLENRKAFLQEEQKTLESRLEETKKSSSIEYNARKELGVIKPEETEYRFPPPDKEDK